MSAPAMVSGIGQYHTDKKGGKFSTITMAEIRQMADNPPSVDKSDGRWCIASTLMTRVFKEQEARGEFWMLWSDLDKDPLPLAEVDDVIRQIVGDADFEIYTSRSARIDYQKAHVLIPLDAPLNGSTWLHCQDVLNDKLRDAGIVPDKASRRRGQLCYLPNAGEYYDNLSQRNGQCFDPSAWSAEIAERQLAIDAAQEAAKAAIAAAKAKREQRAASGFNSPIDAFNACYEVEEILLKAGYAQRGTHYRHPASESGSYSASVKDGRVYSLSPNDPLYTAHESNGAHSSFSAFELIYHAGDRNAAIKDAGDDWLTIDGVSWNKYQQREFNREKQQPGNEPALTEIDLSQLLEQVVGGRAADHHHDAPDYPPGLAGDVARYIFGSSRMPIKSFAIAGSLAAISYLNGNKHYVGRSNTALNLYQCLTGETGRGKEGPRQAVKRLFDESMLPGYGGLHETVSSSTALLRALEVDKQALVMTDEFGLWLQVALSERGSSHLKELVKELMSLYGLGRSYYAGKRYADSHNNIGRINSPYVDILATTTPLELLNGITANSVDNGFLNRILFVQADALHPVNRSPATDVPDALKSRITAILTHQHGPLDYDVGAEALMIKLSEGMAPSGQYGNLWARAEEQMIRVAGLLAIEGGRITQAHVQWAAGYVNWSIRTFSNLLGAELTETNFQKHLVKAIKYISNAVNYADDQQFRKLCKRGLMPKGKLLKLMKLPKREMEDVIGLLLETGQIKAANCEGFEVFQFSSRILDSLGGEAA